MGEATGRRWMGRLPTQAHWGCVGAPDEAGPLCSAEDATTWAPHLLEPLADMARVSCRLELPSSAAMAAAATYEHAASMQA